MLEQPGLREARMPHPDTGEPVVVIPIVAPQRRVGVPTDETARPATARL
jgi:hypothetical protein